MATLLLSFKRISSSEILIHGTLSPNATRSAKMLEEHAGICPKFGPEFRADKTIEQEIDVDSIPEFDEQSIGEWLDEEFGFEVDGEDEPEGDETDDLELEEEEDEEGDDDK